MQRIALVGAGGMGSVQARTIAGLPNAEMTGIMDIRPEKAESLAGELGVPSFTDFDKMLKEVKCDAVFIATETPYHHEYGIAAAKAGKHVITEKPIARTVAMAQEMIDACEKAGVRLFVAHVLRWFPQFSVIHQQVKAGAVGTPAVIRTSRGAPITPDTSSWYRNWDKSGGCLFDTSIHDFDWLLWTFGPVVRVFSNGTQPKGYKDLDYSLTTLRFKSGAIAHVESTWARHDQFVVEVEVAGDAGILEYNSLNFPTRRGTGGKSNMIWEDSPCLINPYKAEDEHFIHCLETGEEYLVKPQEALAALRVAEAALESARINKPIDIKDEK